jgi:hypothetical protein
MTIEQVLRTVKADLSVWTSQYQFSTFFHTLAHRQEMDALVNRLQSNLKSFATNESQHQFHGSVVVHGGAGVGKTTLARALFSVVPQHVAFSLSPFSRAVHPIIVNLGVSRLTGVDQLSLALLLSAYSCFSDFSLFSSSAGFSLAEISEHFVSLLDKKYPDDRQRTYVLPVLLDEMQECPDLAAQCVVRILSFNTEKRNHRICFFPLLAGTIENEAARALESSKFVFEVIPLGLLPNDGSDMKLVSSRIPRVDSLFSKLGLAQCIKDCGRVPRYLQLFCAAIESLASDSPQNPVPIDFLPDDFRVFAQAVQEKVNCLRFVFYLR